MTNITNLIMTGLEHCLYNCLNCQSCIMVHLDSVLLTSFSYSLTSSSICISTQNTKVPTLVYEFSHSTFMSTRRVTKMNQLCKGIIKKLHSRVDFSANERLNKMFCAGLYMPIEVAAERIWCFCCVFVYSCILKQFSRW